MCDHFCSLQLGGFPEVTKLLYSGLSFLSVFNCYCINNHCFCSNTNILLSLCQFQMMIYVQYTFCITLFFNFAYWYTFPQRKLHYLIYCHHKVITFYITIMCLYSWWYVSVSVVQLQHQNSNCRNVCIVTKDAS